MKPMRIVGNTFKTTYNSGKTAIIVVTEQEVDNGERWFYGTAVKSDGSVDVCWCLSEKMFKKHLASGRYIEVQ